MVRLLLNGALLYLLTVSNTAPAVFIIFSLRLMIKVNGMLIGYTF
jgi:hypothetical protein